MTNTQIEQQGINILKQKILEFQYMIPYITENDKTGGWDGEIHLFDKDEKNKQNSNKFFRGKIQVQVKSTEKIKNNSYSIEKTYLDMFAKDGNGTLLFVVDVTNKKVYYKNLFQVEIEKILEQFKDGQKSKSIKIKLVEREEKNIIDKVCENFWKHSKIQRNVTKIDSQNYKDILEKNMEFKITKFDGDTYVYIKDNITKKYNYMLNDIQEIMMTNSRKIEILSNNNKYLLKIEYVFSDMKLKKVIIGDTITISITTSRIDFELENTNIKNTIKIIKFILDCIKEQKIEIKDLLSVDLKEIPKEYEIFLEERLEYLEKIQNKLNKYGVELKSKIKDLSEEDWEKLNILTNLKSYKKLEEKNIFCIEIKNKFIFVLLIKDNDGLIKDYNYFEERKENFEFIVNDGYYKYSPYINLKKEELINALNMNTQTIEKSIKKIYTPELSEKYTLFLLEVLMAYDETKEARWLELSEMIITLIISKEKENNNIYIINKYQILRRKRKLTDKEKNELKAIYDSDKNVMIKASCAILIDNSYDFKFNFEKLNEKEMKISGYMRKKFLAEIPVINSLNLHFDENTIDFNDEKQIDLIEKKIIKAR